MPGGTGTVGRHRLDDRLRDGSRRPGTDLELHLAGLAGGSDRAAVRVAAHEFQDPRQRVLADPVDDVVVRGEQLEHAAFLDRLQRPDPGVEMLFRHLGFELTYTTIPEQWIHRRGLPGG